jgi:hypothetical protein
VIVRLSYNRPSKIHVCGLLFGSSGLDGVWNKLEKPLLDGSDIQRVLQIPKGPLVGNWVHPDASLLFVSDQSRCSISRRH